MSRSNRLRRSPQHGRWLRGNGCGSLDEVADLFVSCPMILLELTWIDLQVEGSVRKVREGFDGSLP